MGNSVGFWTSCSGCVETSDGYNVFGYPTHPKHGVLVGSGCDECKRKGIVFFHFTKADADYMALESGSIRKER